MQAAAARDDAVAAAREAALRDAAATAKQLEELHVSYRWGQGGRGERGEATCHIRWIGWPVTHSVGSYMVVAV